MTSETRERSRIEEIGVDASGLTDGEVVAAALRLIATANYDTDLPPAIRKFFGKLARQLSDLVAWREGELERIERALREVESDEPDLWNAPG